MAWIRIIPEDEADDELGRCYEAYRDPGEEQLDEVLAVHSLHPAGMDAHWAVYRAAMDSTASLRKRDRELIALVVSAINGCLY